MIHFEKNRVTAACIVLLATTFFHSCTTQTKGSARLGRIKKSTLTQRVTLSGKVVPKKRAVITAPYDGYVKRIYVKVGDLIQAGSPIVSVVPSLQSNENVYPLRSPFSGQVVQIQKTEGEFVRKGDSTDFMVLIDDLTSLFILAKVPEVDIVRLKLDQEAVIRTSAIIGKTYHGKIREISIAAQRQDRWRESNVEFPIKIEIVNKDSRMRPGLTTLIDIVTDERKNVFVLEHEFIERDGDQYFVTLQKGERRRIQVGLQNETYFEILSGLEDSDDVRQIDFLNQTRME